MNFRGLLLPMLSVLFFTACHNKLEVNAPYKEIPSIYAVLDPSEDKQMIRVNKVFLGEGDATQMAKIADSVNYPANELRVTLSRYVDGKRAPASKSSGDSLIVFTEEMITTIPGSFNTNQRVYVTKEKLFDEGEYRLSVKNQHTGNEFKSSAKALKPIAFSPFLPLSEPPYYPYPPTAQPETYIDYSANKTFEVRYSPNDAYIYQLVIRYHMIDSSLGYSEPFLVDYNAGTKRIKDVQKVSTFLFQSHTFTGSGIFTSIANDVSKMKLPGVGRKPIFIEYIVYNSTVEYSDYMDYSKPSLNLTQNKPLYSNFENQDALGLFTFRTKISVNKMPSKLYINAFSSNAATCSYRFLNQYNQVVGCK